MQGEGRTGYQDTLLIHYWYILRKRRHIIFLFLGIFMVTVFVASVYATKYYQAVAVIEISPKEPVIFDVEEVADMVTASNFQDMRIYYQTQYHIMMSRTVMEQAIQRLKDEYHLTDFDDKEDPVEYLRRLITIKPEVDTHLVDIIVEHPDPETAANIANVVAEVYMHVNVDRALEATRDALRYLEEQQEKYRELARESDERVHAFKYENDLIGMDKEKNTTLENLDRLRNQLSEVHTEKIQVQATYQELKRLAESGDWLGLANHLAKESPVLQQMLAQYQNLVQERTELSSRYLDKHPSIVRVDNEMKGLEAQIRKQLDDLTAAYKADLDLLVKKEQALSNEMEKVEKELEELDRKLIELKTLETEAERNQMFFKSLDTRLSEVDLSQVIRANNVRFVDRAIPEDEPVRPKLLMNMVLALVIGLLGGAGLAFFAEYLDATVKSREDVENIVGVAFLGVVPLLSHEALKSLDTERDRSIVVYARPRSTVAECLRTIRTNILFRLGRKKKRHQLLITSAAPREGKSFIASNLAAIMAMAGSRVVLIDADLRRPSVHKLFDQPNDLGLAQVLQGTLPIESAILPSHIPNLDIVLAGPHPQNPAELLENGMMQRILKKLESYDVVIVDSPPVNAVADPLVLSTMVDGVVFVVETNQTKRSLVRNARTRLSEMNANIIGAVVNKLDVRRAGYGYYYYYYYENYPYYYGESEDSASEAPKSA